MADLASAEATREGAVTRGTHEEQARSWSRWTKYCASIGLDDVFLDGFTRGQRIKLMGAFALALRDARFSPDRYASLAETTVRGAISYVSQTFRENDRPNPTKDEDNELGRLLSRLYRAFKNSDPNPAQQKALPIGVLRKLAKLSSTETQRATTQLSIGGFFFACRSCEYVKVQHHERRRTDILRLRSIRFILNGRIIAHDDSRLIACDYVSITFEWQKKDERMDTVTQRRSGDATLCPARQWAQLIQRIRKYPGASDSTPVSAVWRNNRIEHISSEELVTALRCAVHATGEDLIGIKAEEVGCHSIRSGAAMAMYLGECPVFVMMMIGRWSSDAFLRYIRKQVEQFSHNVSSRMLRFELHRHVSEPTPSIDPQDPRQRNHRDNAETRRNFGGDRSVQRRLPAYSVFG